MKIRCRREKFLPLFNLISSFTSARDVRPVLQNVKIVADEKNVLLTATDGEVGGRGSLPVEEGFVLESAGEAILPAKLLKKILTETTDDEITLEFNNGKLVVRGQRSKYQLDTSDDWDKFPAVADFSETSYIKIAAKSLCELIRRTVFATDVNNSHYELRGVKFIFSEDRTVAVATDGRRLAHQECASERCGEASGDGEFSLEAIFPPRALNLIERAASDVEDVLIAIRDTEALVKVGDVVVSTTLMVGRFPDWKAIIPEPGSKRRVDFIAGELARAIRQAEIVATESKPGVWFNFTEGSVDISAAGEATGESSVVLPIAYSGEEHKLRLDSRFLNEFFRCISPEETVAFYFFGDYRTLLETTDGYQYVVMQLA